MTRMFCVSGVGTQRVRGPRAKSNHARFACTSMREESGRKIIAPKHINLGVRADAELNKLMTNIVISQGGMLPYVHDYLVPPKKGGKKNAMHGDGHADASQPL